MSFGQSAKWRESHSSTCRTYIYFWDDEGLAISKQSQAIVSYSSAMPLPLNDSPLRPNYIEDFDITLEQYNTKWPNANLLESLWNENKESMIAYIEKIHSEKKEYIYHAGTKNNLNKIYSNGGRVLNFVVLSDNFKFSRERAIRLIEKLSWSNGFYRKDIGFKVTE